jgi:membrane-associated phospholipid phosphatase
MGATLGLVLGATALLLRDSVVEQWILPPSLLLIGYWSSGLLFVAPMARAERALLGLDATLNVRLWASRAPHWLAELLECAYLAIYPLIPIALGLHVMFVRAPDTDGFWTVILATDFICFGVLPWVQTRPPRSLESGEPWSARVRALNLRLLGSSSIQVNTFPSGHAAEALAAALLLLAAPSPVFLVVLATAVAISAGAVLGRYHFAADVFAGWVVALGVWGITMR